MLTFPPRTTIDSAANRLDGEPFTDLDRHFAELMERLSGAPNPEVALAAALASRSQGQGNTCLDLRSAATPALPNHGSGAGSGLQLPGPEDWITALRKSPVVGKPSEFKPLILDESGRLYLHRFWQYEHDLATAIQRRAGQQPEVMDEATLREGLDRLFPATGNTDEIDWQRIAASSAVRKRFCVISGGPGTGKTRTVVAILVLLLEQAASRPMRIALAAPTGKAAARLQEALKQWRGALPCQESIKARLPEESFTLHRLLGSQPDSAEFRYHAGNPLPFDVVVVDEASMVDLALMARLFAATPASSRLVLLGDKDQLASVEAGAVLGDICAGAAVGQASSLPPGLPAPDSGPRAGSPDDSLEACPTTPALAGCIVQLQKNYRFVEGNGILALSRAINDGDAEGALGLLRAQSSPGLQQRPESIFAVALPSPPALKNSLRERVLEGFGHVMRSRDPLAALKALGRSRILCALRQGPYGAEALNRLAEEILTEAQLIPPRERWYAGRPVMITRNDYQLKLFNGDVGVILPDAVSGQPRAWFLGTEDVLRSIPTIRLPDHETVFAMTVHKSQGSEFEEVLLILADRDSPILTRELLYTGATRASRRVECWFNEPEFRAALSRRVQRASGLRDALWGQSMVMCTQQQRRSAQRGCNDTID
jgi:exodeoxyribonuclease V alpha subunit